MAFGSVNWHQLRDRVCRRDGLDPSSTLTNDAADGIAEHLTAACKYLWLYHPWTESRRVSSVAPSGRFLDPANDVATTGHHWEEVLAVYRDNPLENEQPREITVRAAELGYYVVGAAPPASVYVVWRPGPPQWTNRQHVSGWEYALGEITYEPSAGECYRSLADGNTNATTSTAHWLPERLPSRLAEAAVLMAWAGMRREDGQANAADALENQADMLMAQEVVRESAGEAQTVFARGGTY